MTIRFAEEKDFEKWLIIAKDVSQIFGHPTMDSDPEFIEYAKRKISQKEAFIAVNDENTEFYGIIGFSRNFNRITWFGVLENSRNKGIGGKLLDKALNELDFSKEISVETYRENYLPGLPARSIYKKYGFVEIDTNLFDGLGNERSKFIISGK